MPSSCASKDQLVDGLLLAGKVAPDRERPRDVARVVAVLAAGIDEEQLARVDAPVVLAVVQDARVRPGADDAAVRGALGAVAAERVEQQRLDLVLVHARARPAHRQLVRLARDARRRAHRLELDGRLAQAHLVEDRARVHDLGRRGDAECADGRARGRWRRAAGRRSGGCRRGGSRRACWFCSRFGSFSSSSAMTKASSAPRRLGAVDARRAARPRPRDRGRAGGRRASSLRVLRVEHEHALGLVEPRQVEEVRVLPVLVLDVVVAR